MKKPSTNTLVGRAAFAATFILLVANLPGCATSGTATRPSAVSDADFARLAASQTEIVDEARSQLLAARDELGRAKLDVVNSQHEGAFARSDQASASADMKRAAVETQVGKDSNEPAQLQRARDETRDARASKEAADDRVAYAKKLDTALAAKVTAAERKVDLMTAKVNLAKLQALERAGVPAAGKYDRDGAMKAVAEAQNAHDAALATATEAGQAADQLRPSQSQR